MKTAGPAAEHVSHRVADPEDPPRELSGLAWGALVCLGLLGIVGLIRIVAALGLRSAVDGSAGDIESAYDAYAAAATLHGLLFLLTAGVFIAWFFRAYKNLGRLGVENRRYGTGWAIGAWFIPFFNWYRPKQIANDAWRGSERGVDVSTQWRRGTVPSLVHWWWGLFLLQGLVLEVGQERISAGYDKLTSFASFDDGLSRIENGTLVDVVGGLCSFAGVVLAMLVVRELSRRLDQVREDALATEAGR